MRSGDFVQRKMQAWARRHHIRLQGSAGDRGEPNYVFDLRENLFEDLHPDVRVDYSDGAGGELRGEIPSMHALHSSAALTVNLFHYWVTRQQFSTLANLLEIPSSGIESVRFERQYPVCADPKTAGFGEPPHLDLGVDYKDGSRVGVECKLFEPYGRLSHQPLKSPYLALDTAWEDIPACRELGVELSTSSGGFNRLGPTQLLRHVLGLKHESRTDRVRLIYLYFDAIGDEAAEHRAEINLFQQRIGSDPVRFVPLTVQEFVARAFLRCDSEHGQYVDYMTDRYL